MAIGKGGSTLFFIDGGYSYKSVMNNFEVALRLLNEDGCIASHGIGLFELS